MDQIFLREFSDDEMKTNPEVDEVCSVSMVPKSPDKRPTEEQQDSPVDTLNSSAANIAIASPPRALPRRSPRQPKKREVNFLLLKFILLILYLFY